MAKEGKVYSSTSFKCENCGSTYSYDPEGIQLKCEHCGSIKKLERTTYVKEKPFSKQSLKESCDWDGTKFVKCEDCGAEFILEGNQTATCCPFCGAQHIIDQDEIPGLKPDGICPFEITYQNAKELFIKWINKRMMAPIGFKNMARSKELNGIYIPVFTFDCDTQNAYHISYGVRHTRTVGSGKNTRTETYVTHHTDSGVAALSFNDVTVEASSNITQDVFDRLGGYNTDRASSYHNQFICGYTSERYNEGLDVTWDKARQIIEGDIRSYIRGLYPQADEVYSITFNTQYSNNTYKYILVPLYRVSYVYKDKSYEVRINGVNGHTDGNSPISKLKVSAIVVSVLIVIAIITVLVLYFTGNL